MIASVGAMLIAVNVLAQEVTSTARQTKAVTVATVNIYNAKIVSQSGNDFTIAFDLNNRTGVQPGIKYEVSLQRMVEGAAPVVMDRKVYAETIALGENETKHMEVIYGAPRFLSGTYALMVYAKNADGFPLGLARLGNVTVASSGERIVVDTSSCYLTVQEDKQPVTYDLIQGVDVLSAEHLVAHCGVKNESKQAVTAVPMFTTHYRTVFGNKVGEVKAEAMTFAAGETKIVDIEIPKQNDPQAYDVVFGFVDAQGNDVSNKAAFHYVVAGQTATIQNVVFDKDSYARSDVAKIGFLVTGPASSFPNSRTGRLSQEGMVVEMQLIDKNEKACAEPIKQAGILNTEITIPVIADCSGPQLDVAVKDKDGKLLVERRFSTPVAEKGFGMWWWVGGVIAIAIIAWFGTMMIKKGKVGAVVKALVVMCMISGGLVMANTASADTFYVVSEYTGQLLGQRDVRQSVLGANEEDWEGEFIEVVFMVNLNKASYSPGEEAIAMGDISYGQCSNGSILDTDNSLSVTINGRTESMAFRGAASGSAGLAVERTPGIYGAIFRGTAHLTEIQGFLPGSGEITIPYSVTGEAAVVEPPEPPIVVTPLVVTSTSVPSVSVSAPTTVEIPDSVWASWSSSDADSCSSWGDWSASGLSGFQTIWGATSPAQRGNHTFGMNCSGPGGSASDSASTRVVQLPRCSFTANPATIVLPQESVLSWSCQYADACSIDNGVGVANPVSGSKSVRPQETTTYTLMCSAPDGSRSFPTTVSVGSEIRIREVLPGE